MDETGGSARGLVKEGARERRRVEGDHPGQAGMVEGDRDPEEAVGLGEGE